MEEFKGADAAQNILDKFHRHAHAVYKGLVEGHSAYKGDQGYHYIHDPVAPELARTVLPVGTYTKFTWASDLHNLFHFLTLRTDPHAQGEMQEYALLLSWIVKQWVPTCWAAWAEGIEGKHNLFHAPSS